MSLSFRCLIFAAIWAVLAPDSVSLSTIAAHASSGLAEMKQAEHPFMLWTRQEAAAIRQRIQTEPWARAQYEAMLREKGLGQTFRNLFRLVVMGDESVVEGEKKYLLSLAGNDPRKF